MSKLPAAIVVSLTLGATSVFAANDEPESKTSSPHVADLSNASVPALKEIFQKLDSNKDGALSFDEFSKIAGKSPKAPAKPSDPATPASTKAGADPQPALTPTGSRRDVVFKNLDKNQDSFLSLAEFKTMTFAQKDPAKAERIFKRQDKNGDGLLSFEEYSTSGTSKSIDDDE